MFRVFILVLFSLTHFQYADSLPHKTEQESWLKIKARFSGDVEVKKNKDGSFQSLRTSKLIKNTKGDKGWVRLSLNKDGYVTELSSDMAGFTNEEFKLFKAFSKLTKLTLWHNSNFHNRKEPSSNYGGAGLVHLTELPITRLTLAGGGIDDEGMKAAAKLPNLEYIGMWHVPASDLGMTYLEGHPKLEELRIGPFGESF